MSVVRGLGRLQDEAAFPAWVYRIVSNKCRDWIRRESRRRKATKSYSEAVEVSSEGDRAHSQTESLKDAVAQLPGTERALLCLYYEEGFPVAEIAEILEIPAGTVKSRLHYARQRLRAKMEETDNE